MFEVAEEKKVGLQPMRFAYACMVMFAGLAIVLDLRRFGLLMVLRVGAPAAILATALPLLNTSESRPDRRLGNGALALMCIVSVAVIIWVIFFP